MKDDKNDLNFDFFDPNKWRWLVFLLCMLSFFTAFKLTAYGADLGGHLSSYDSSVQNSTISHYMEFDYGTSTYDLSVIDLPEAFTDYVFYRHSLYASDNGYVCMIFLGPDSTVKMSIGGDSILLTNYYYIDQKIYSSGHTSEIFDDLKFKSAGYVPFSSSFGDCLEGSSVDIYYEDGDSFFMTPQPSILEGVTLTNPLTEILGILPILLMVILFYLGLRKALNFLFKNLRTC